MTRFTKLPTQALAIGLFAITGLAAANPAAANPMADFVDCTDSFWAVACSANAEPATPDATPADVPVPVPAPAVDVIVGEFVTIDSAGDPVCTETEDGFIICHS